MTKLEQLVARSKRGPRGDMWYADRGWARDAAERRYQNDAVYRRLVDAIAVSTNHLKLDIYDLDLVIEMAFNQLIQSARARGEGIT